MIPPTTSQYILEVTTRTTIGNVNGTNDLTNDLILLDVLTQVFCVVVIVFGVIGNVLVLIVFLSRWAVLHTYEVFIVILAAVDLLGTMTLPSIQIHELRGRSFKGIGTAGCKIVYFLSDLSIYVSSLTLVMVSIDRYVAVKWPLKERKCACRWMIASAWILGSCNAAVIGNRMRLENMNKRWICRMFADNTEITIMTVVTFLIHNVIPIIVMGILYCLIICELRKSTTHARFCMNEEEFHHRHRRNKKTIKLLVVVVAIFFVCVTPSNMFYILYRFENFHIHGLPDKYIFPIYAVLLMLKMSNSCVNPLIYGKLHTSFRKQTIKYFSSCFNFLGLHRRGRFCFSSPYVVPYTRTSILSLKGLDENTHKEGKNNTGDKVTESAAVVTRNDCVNTCTTEEDRFDREMPELDTVTMDGMQDKY